MNERVQIRVADRLADVERESWNRVANPPGAPFDPFLSWDFLEAMESSGSAVPEEGWSPCHLLIEDDGGELAAAMPLYAKAHSYGEFVFDHSWADAFNRAGGRYYPKLLGAVPFTPVGGRRLLAPPGESGDTLRQTLLAGALQLARDNGLSSLHLNFLSDADAAFSDDAGLMMRSDQQYHFFDEEFGDFDGFLAALTSSRRKNLRKERRKAQDGIDYRWLTGTDLTEDVWDRFYVFYEDTGARKWGSPYLKREAFSLLGERMAGDILLVMAEADGDYIGGALNFIGSEALYGRYWGCTQTRPFMHFETCYYQAIDYALAHGLKRVEAGAQGGHKIARGYVPVETRSAHWVADPSFRHAIDNYLQRERRAVHEEMAYLEDRTPFRKETP